VNILGAIELLSYSNVWRSQKPHSVFLSDYHQTLIKRQMGISQDFKLRKVCGLHVLRTEGHSPNVVWGFPREIPPRRKYRPRG
jgi:hypothetical protein